MPAVWRLLIGAWAPTDGLLQGNQVLRKNANLRVGHRGVEPGHAAGIGLDRARVGDELGQPIDGVARVPADRKQAGAAASSSAQVVTLGTLLLEKAPCRCKGVACA